MNKIKIFNEQERVKVELDFDNIEVARLWFSDEECIEDVLGVLCGEEESEDVTDKEISEAEEKLKVIKEEVKEILRKADDSLLREFGKMIQDELGERK